MVPGGEAMKEIRFAIATKLPRNFRLLAATTLAIGVNW
jgi:hypothetical protein